MRQASLTTAAALLLAKSTLALVPGSLRLGVPEEHLENLPAVLAKTGGVSNGTFQQLIDHDSPEKGTFTQHYYYNADYYHGPGSPVVLMTPGESQLQGFAGYATNATLTGFLAQQAKAGVIVLEHRYYGNSSPYQELTTANMTDLTLRNSIRDLTHFANHAVLPFDRNRTSTPDKAPWVLSGCSYSGALTAWTHNLEPGTFWAYHASSAVVQAIPDLWAYGDTVGQAMARNCSADYVKIVDAVDAVLLGNDQAAKKGLKAKFGLAALEYDDDFASALFSPLGAWQSNSFSSGYGPFAQMCDYIENQWPNSTAPAPGPEGVGVEKALNGLATWISQVFLKDACKDFSMDPYDIRCLQSHNASETIYTNTSVANVANRQWEWFLCNEPFEWWQDRGEGNFVSRLLTKEMARKQCGYFFPEGADGETFGLSEGRTVEDVNDVTGGWFNVDTKRLTWTVGEFDPWRPATPMSYQRPGGQLTGTPEHPVNIIPGGAHCGDLSFREYHANEGVKKVMDAELETLQQWIGEFYEEKGKQWPGR